MSKDRTECSCISGNNLICKVEELRNGFGKEVRVGDGGFDSLGK